MTVKATEGRRRLFPDNVVGVGARTRQSANEAEGSGAVRLSRKMLQ